MKLSGNKIVITISAIVVILMLIVPVLPASFFQSEIDSRCEEAIEYPTETTKKVNGNSVYVGFSIGREISLSL